MYVIVNFNARDTNATVITRLEGQPWLYLSTAREALDRYQQKFNNPGLCLAELVPLEHAEKNTAYLVALEDKLIEAGIDLPKWNDV